MFSKAPSVLSQKKQRFHNNIRTEVIQKYMQQIRKQLIQQQVSQNLINLIDATQSFITESDLNLLIHYCNNSNDYAIIHLTNLILKKIIQVRILEKYSLSLNNSFSWLIFFRVCLQRQYCTVQMIQSCCAFVKKVKLQKNILALSSGLQFIKILLRKGNAKILEQIKKESLFLRLLNLTNFVEPKVQQTCFCIMQSLFEESQTTALVLNVLNGQQCRIRQMIMCGLNNDILFRKAIKITNNLVVFGYLNIVCACVDRILPFLFKAMQNASKDQKQYLLITKETMYLFQSIIETASIDAVMHYVQLGILNILLADLKWFNDSNQSYQQQIYYKVKLMTIHCFQVLVQRVINQYELFMSSVIFQVKKYGLQDLIYKQFGSIDWKRYAKYQIQI